METVHIDRKEVEPIITATFPGYTGKKVQVMAAESVTLRDLNWSGGTRSQYAGCSLETGRATGNASAGNAAAPWANPYEGAVVPLVAGMALVEHCLFCGKDLGLRIYVHPSMLPKFLPSGGLELTEEEKIVLRCIRSLIESARREYAARDGVSAAQYDRVVEALKVKGLCAKNGSLTLAGKNAAQGLRS